MSPPAPRPLPTPVVVSQIEVGKSTRADVTALLGSPLTASYGDQGEETWHYAWVTTAPTAELRLCPWSKPSPPLQGETTREFAVTFSPDGAVKSLGPHQPPREPRSSG